MTGYKPSQIADLVLGTLNDLGPQDFVQIAQELTEYVVLPQWLKKERVMFDSGIGIQRTLMTQLTEVARFVGLYEEDSVVLADHLKQMNLPWCRADTHWIYDVREPLMNKGKAMVTNVIKPRRANSLLDLCRKLEVGGWTTPTAANLGSEPCGIPYWIVKNTATGFNGGLPSDHTTVAGVDLTVSPKYQNYTAQYALLTLADWTRKMRTGCMVTGFKSPVPDATGSITHNDRRKIYCNLDGWNDMVEAAQGNNENLGPDLDKYNGEVAFNRLSIQWVPYLDTDTTDPFYLVDHNTFKTAILKGDYLRETGPRDSKRSHNIKEMWTDLTFQFLCLDRRRNAVISK